MESQTIADAENTPRDLPTPDQIRPADISPDDGEGAQLPLRSVLRFLVDHADIAALHASFPDLTEENVRECLDGARALVHDTRVVQRRKSANQTTIVRTHGLPEPDGSMHKGNIFRALLTPLRPGRLLDLGAGKGNFSLSAAELGWQVTAVDARTVRWPDLESATDPDALARIRSIRWVQADVREFPIAPGDYDLICILGLLHHLEVADQIALLRRCAGTLLLIDTRIAPAAVDTDGRYAGMIVREHGESREERDQVPTAAWGNPLSFRHTEESLVRLVRDSGYAQVMQMRPPHRRDYTFYLCLPPLQMDTAHSNRRATRRRRRE